VEGCDKRDDAEGLEGTEEVGVELPELLREEAVAVLAAWRLGNCPGGTSFKFIAAAFRLARESPLGSDP